MNDIESEKRKLMLKSKELNGLCFDDKNKEKSFKLKQLQNEIYKKWKFYDKFIKAERKIGK